ncbi:hypothetical protein B0H13DRAFT_2655938 [Mycena leptocephala]|nr:hypothetical protein B0H13DRAFT_2655938 [Mycena leptocephala]
MDHREREKAEMDVDMGIDYRDVDLSLHNDEEALSRDNRCFVDPIWLGVQSLIALQILFPSTPIVTSQHTNVPTYMEIFGYPYFHYRTWQIHAYSFARYTLVPSPSTARLLREKGSGTPFCLHPIFSSSNPTFYPLEPFGRVLASVLACIQLGRGPVVVIDLLNRVDVEAGASAMRVSILTRRGMRRRSEFCLHFTLLFLFIRH